MYTMIKIMLVYCYIVAVFDVIYVIKMWAPMPPLLKKISGYGPVRRCPNFGPKSSDEQKKGHSLRKCLNFGPKSSDEQKKGHTLRRCSNFGSTSSDELELMNFAF